MSLTKLRFLLIASSVLLAPPNTAPAQEKLVLDIEKSIEIALKSNPGHLAAQKEVDAAHAALGEARSAFFPSLSLRASYTWLEEVLSITMPAGGLGPGFPPQPISSKLDFTRDYALGLTLTQPLFTGGQLWQNHNRARFLLDRTHEKYRQSEQQLIFDTKMAFYGCLLARKMFDVAEEAIELAKRHLEATRDRYQVGLASKFDLLRAEVELANLQPRLIEARNHLHLTELGLKATLGLRLDREIVLEGDLLTYPYQVHPESAIATALENRPELRQMRVAKSLAEVGVGLARASDKPSLAVVANYNYQRDGFSPRLGEWEDYHTVNLVLSVPLFQGRATHYKVAQAKASVEGADLGLRQLTQGIELEVRQAYLGFLQVSETLLSQDKSVEQARESVRIAEASYAEGLASSLDVFGAQVALSQARTAYARAQYEYLVSIARLEKAMGIVGR